MSNWVNYHHHKWSYGPLVITGLLGWTCRTWTGHLLCEGRFLLGALGFYEALQPRKTIVPNRNLLFQGCKSSDSMSNFQGCKMYLFLCIFNMRDEISVCWFTRLYSHLHSRPKWQSAIWNEGFWVRSGNSHTTTFTLDFAQTDHSRILGAFF